MTSKSNGSFVPASNCSSCARPNFVPGDASGLVALIAGSALVAGLTTGFIARRVVRGGKKS